LYKTYSYSLLLLFSLYGPIITGRRKGSVVWNWLWKLLNLIYKGTDKTMYCCLKLTLKTAQLDCKLDSSLRLADLFLHTIVTEPTPRGVEKELPSNIIYLMLSLILFIVDEERRMFLILEYLLIINNHDSWTWLWICWTIHVWNINQISNANLLFQKNLFL
jgi:hypothetical protein